MLSSPVLSGCNIASRSYPIAAQTVNITINLSFDPWVELIFRIIPASVVKTKISIARQTL